ncbi:MAG: hypothetical protein ACOVMQ_00255 [Cyclobacteriaceae bacterium]
MENRLDELFKSKLEHHASAPSGEAWLRVEKSLAKKNNSFAVWRIAAGVLLLAGLISAIYWSQSGANETTTQRVAQKKEKPAKRVVTPAPVAAAVSSVVQQTPSIASVKPAKKKSARTSETQAQVARPTESTPVTIPAETTVATVTVAEETVAVPMVAEVKPAGKPIVLEYTLAPVNPEVIARTEEKNSSFKKLITKARDIKNGESGIDISDLTSKLFAANHKQNKDNIN